MKRFKKIIVMLLSVLIGLFNLTGCNLMSLLNPQPTSIPPTLIPSTEVTICLGYEPRSLYPYQASSQAAQEVLQAIYDGPIDILSSLYPRFCV
jgi:peptide/nickel transport system substrate-binding protein